MRCCVPNCETSADAGSCSTRSTFTKFPYEEHLRAAWLRAIGIADSRLTKSAVVCSQHFLSYDFYATKNGISQIRTGAIPTTIQVCMICFNTRCKLLLMSKYKLDEAYEHLVGQPLGDTGNLRQTVCVECAQRLVNFSRFRDKSLRTRSLIMELIRKHELITIKDIKSISRMKHQLTSDIVKIVLEPDHCDMYVAHSDVNSQMKLEVFEVKREHSPDFATGDANMYVDNGDTSSVNMLPVGNEEEHLPHNCNIETDQMSPALLAQPECEEKEVDAEAPIKDEITFACTTCLKEFGDEDTYTCHVIEHMNEDQNSFADYSHTAVTTAANILINQKIKSHPSAEINNVKRNVLLNSIDADDDVEYILVTENNKTIIKGLKKSKHKLMESNLEGHVKISSEKSFVCDVCNYKFTEKNSLVTHMKTHTNEKTFACQLCSYTCPQISHLMRHMKIHIDEKHFACQLCSYKCSHISHLVRHMRIHTYEKPFACKLCSYKCNHSSSLARHIRTHTGEKPFACKLCSYKCAVQSSLAVHMRNGH